MCIRHNDDRAECLFGQPELETPQQFVRSGAEVLLFSCLEGRRIRIGVGLVDLIRLIQDLTARVLYLA